MSESGSRGSSIHAWTGSLGVVVTIILGVLVLLYGDHWLKEEKQAEPDILDKVESVSFDNVTTPLAVKSAPPPVSAPKPEEKVKDQSVTTENPTAEANDEVVVEDVAREPVAPVKNLRPPIGLISLLCQRKALAISFHVSDYHTSQFRYLSGDHVVTITECDEETGRFVTITELPGRKPRSGKGFATERRISFEFNTFVTTGGGNMTIDCTVGAADIDSREFSGTIKCVGRKSAEWTATIAL